MHLLLQWLGGGLYLLHKVYLSFAERATRPTHARRWRIAAWSVYLAGLPPWVIIFIHQHNWIAASVEASGAPAMVLGLVLACRGSTTASPRWLDRLALVCIPLGFFYSLYDFGGLTSLSQWLEIGLVIGFLVGSYQTAKLRPAGYLWFVLMHLCCGLLMWWQHYGWLALQQAVSLLFIADAYRHSQKPPRGDSSGA